MKMIIRIFKNIKGFSLIELALTIMVVGILLAYAIPQYSNWTLDAKKVRAKHDLAMLAEQISKYELDQNMQQTKGIVRLRSLNELKGKYISDPSKLRDPWNYDYLILPEKGEIIKLELFGYKLSDGTTIQINPNKGEKLPNNLPPGTIILYKKFIEDYPNINPRGNPKIVYSKGPNGIDEKGQGDDIKHLCRPFKYFHSIVEMKQ